MDHVSAQGVDGRMITYIIISKKTHRKNTKLYVPTENSEVQRAVCIYPQRTLRCRELYILTEDFAVQRACIYTHRGL